MKSSPQTRLRDIGCRRGPQTNQKYLLFQSGGLLFGVVADYVVEIITNHTVTTFPWYPIMSRALSTCGDKSFPIVDIRNLLDQPADRADCIIILNIDEVMVGILVDTVQRMIDLDQQKILPSLLRMSQAGIGYVLSLSDGQTMLAFDCPPELLEGSSY